MSDDNWAKGVKKPRADLPIETFTIVPSTRNKINTISDAQFEGRVQETQRALRNFFGGSTSVEGRGEYLLKGKYIPERVSIVHSYSTKRKYKFNKRKWISWCKKKRRQWGQDSLGIGIEGDMYYV